MYFLHLLFYSSLRLYKQAVIRRHELKPEQNNKLLFI